VTSVTLSNLLKLFISFHSKSTNGEFYSPSNYLIIHNIQWTSCW